MADTTYASPNRFRSAHSAARQLSTNTNSSGLSHRLHSLTRGCRSRASASNAGSVVGLLGYPFLVEPRVGLATQTRTWSWAYVGFVALVVACGVAVFIMLRSMDGYLRGSQDAYYRDYGFGEVFAHATRAPSSLEAGLAAVPEPLQDEARLIAVYHWVGYVSFVAVGRQQRLHFVPQVQEGTQVPGASEEREGGFQVPVAFAPICGALVRDR